MIARISGALKALLVLTLLLASYVVWAKVTDRDLVWPVSMVMGDGREDTGSDPNYRDLDVHRSSGDAFDGSVTIENTTSGFQDVIVTVDVFDGEQNVGELTGTVTLKPRSASSVDLTSFDAYTSWTDAYVDLFRLPS